MKNYFIFLLCILTLFACEQSKSKNKFSEIEEEFKIAAAWAISKGATIEDAEADYEWTLDTQLAVGRPGSLILIDGFISDIWMNDDMIVILLDILNFGLDQAEVLLSSEQFEAVKEKGDDWLYMLVNVVSIERIPEIAYEYWPESRTHYVHNTTGSRLLHAKLVDCRSGDSLRENMTQ